MKKSAAVKHYGSSSKLADALEISRQAVSQWLEDSIPPLQQIKLQTITLDKLRADSDCWDRVLKITTPKGLMDGKRLGRKGVAGAARKAVAGRSRPRQGDSRRDGAR